MTSPSPSSPPAEPCSTLTAPASTMAPTSSNGAPTARSADVDLPPVDMTVGATRWWWPALQQLFDTQALSPFQLALILVASTAAFVAVELEKWIIRRRSRRSRQIPA